MKQTYVLNLTSNSKVWAFAMEMAYRKSLDGDTVILLDTSNVPYVNFLSLSRRRFQKQILNSGQVQVTKKRFSPNEYVREVVHAYIKFRQGRKINSFPSITYGEVELSSILQARISTYLGIREYSFSEVPWRVFKRHFITATISSKFFLKHFPKSEATVTAYNGREVMSAVLLQHAFKRGFPTLIGERGSDNGKFQLFDNSPHFHPNWWDLISNYENFDLEDTQLSQRVVTYKQSKLSGFDTYFSDIWNPPRDLIEGTGLGMDGYILFLSSSSTEYSPFDIYNSDLGYRDQFEAVEILANECLNQDKILVIRRHPKSIGIDGVDREARFWKKISLLTNVIYISPTQNYSSYKLAEDAQVVFVWKSSMGYESMLMGKPTYALGTSKWGWDPQVQCWSNSRISECVMSPKLESVSQNIIQKYSQFMSTSGTDFLLFSSVDKWGVVTKSGKKIFNLFLERLRRKVHDYTLKLTRRERKRNA